MWIDRLDVTIKKLLKNDEVVHIVNSFLKKACDVVFTDINNLQIFENGMFWLFFSEDKEHFNDLTLMSLSSPVHTYTNHPIAKYFWAKVGYLKYFSVAPVMPFYNENFKFFYKIIGKRVETTDENEMLVTSWLLLKTIAIKYYNDIFIKELGEFYLNIDKLTFDDCVNTFFNIDRINPKSKYYLSLLTYYLVNNGKYYSLNVNECYWKIVDKIFELDEERQLTSYELNLLQNDISKQNNITIEDTDLMTGSEFENFIALLFQKLGYSVTQTKLSGDQGIDIIAEKFGRKMGIQAKCYSNTVPNSAIQEVSAGIGYYGLDKALVVTNNYFTKSAIELAAVNSVFLWDRKVLKEKIETILVQNKG